MAEERYPDSDDEFICTSDHSAASLYDAPPPPPQKRPPVKRKKANPQDNPVYQAVINGKSSTTTKKKTSEARKRARMSLVDDQAIEEEEEDEGRTRNSKSNGHRKAAVVVHDLDDDNEDAKESEKIAVVEHAKACADSSASESESAKARCHTEVFADSLGHAVQMLDDLHVQQARLSQWIEFWTGQVDDMKQAVQVKDAAHTTGKTFSSLSDMAAAFSKLAPHPSPSGKSGKQETEFRTLVMDTLKDSQIVAITSGGVYGSRGRKKCSTITYVHKTEEGLWRVTAWVHEKHADKACIIGVDPSRSIPTPLHDGQIDYMACDYVKEDHTMASWSPAFHNSRSKKSDTEAATYTLCPEYEFAARLFLLANAVGLALT